MPVPAATSTTRPSPMVHGYRKAVAKARLWARIWQIARRCYGQPGRAAAVLMRMVAARRKVRPWTTRKYAFVAGRYFWNLYSPGWPSEAFDSYIENELDRIEPFRSTPPALQAAIFAITKSCALQCEHCCEWHALNRTETLSRADLREVVARLHASGATQLLLSGGEPLRRFDDLISLTSLAHSKSDVWIITSGVGLTRTRATQLRDAGLTGVILSLDHWDEQQHDQFRGFAGAFRAVVRAAEACHAAELVIGLSLCATRAFVSAHNLERYAHTSRALGASFIQLLEPKAVGRYERQDVALLPDQQRILEAFCDRLNQHADCLDFPAVAYADYTSRSAQCYGAGDRHLYIDTDGSIHPCPFCRGARGSALHGHFEASLLAVRQAGCPQSRR